MKQEDIRVLAVELPEDVLKAKWCGDFERAERIIQVYLNSERSPEILKKRLLVEREILARLPLDYQYTLEEALEIVQKEIPDFTMEELESFMDQGKIDWIYINGKPHTATRFYATLVKVQPDVARRAGRIKEDFNETDLIQRRMLITKAMKEEGAMKAHIRLRAQVKIKDSSYKDGKVLVHLPIPKPQKNMQNIRVLSTFPEQGTEGVEILIGDENQAARTVAFIENMKENHPFVVEYEYDSIAPYVDLTKAPTKKNEETYLPEDLAEVAPHIRFTDTIKALCAEIKEGETDSLKIARRFYDYVTTKVVYSFMREYFTLEQIPEYAGLGLRGDCGVQALLFITLCRCAGIPARWQSGLDVTPEFRSMEAEAGMHDWAMFYNEEYGWLFADCSYGGAAYRSGNTHLWNHYFGNLDADRMAANDAYQGDLIPDKNYTRKDPYDNQAGEIEYDDRGLFREEYERDTYVIEYTPIK